MKKVLLLTVLVSLAFGFSYKPISGCINLKGKEYVVIRSLINSNKKYYLIVNEESLNTNFTSQEQNLSRCTNLNSRYFKLLNRSIEPPFPLQNDGITHFSSGIVLTTDLCPSSKNGFEDRLYNYLFTKLQNPVPITLFITKRWIQKHQIAFNQLKQWQREGKLDITWGNHTAYHIYHPKLKFSNNFVLSKEENLPKDILDLEIELIKNGITPSIFFRFPGLVSNKKAIEMVKSFGLITIGSNAWIAKGEDVKSGSIILLHGNKNEPKGVDIFLKNMENNRTFFDIISKNLKDIKWQK